MTDASPTLILCCTKDMRHMLPPVLELLVGRGLTTEVVSGLELRPEAPLVAAQRLPNSRFVLFSDGDPLVIDRARTKLIEGGVAASRIAAMPSEWQGPAEVLRVVEGMGIEMLPGPRRTTQARLPELPSFPPPQTLDATLRQPLLSGSVAVLDARALEGEPSRLRPVHVAGGAFAAIALVIAIGFGVSGNEPEAAPPPATAWTFLQRAVANAPVNVVVEAEKPKVGESIAVAGIVAKPSAPSTPAIVAPIVAPPISAPIVAAPPIAAVTPSGATPPAPSISDVDIEVAAEPEIDSEEMRSIYAGLVSQKFRALDILLIAPEPRKKVRKRYTKSPARMGWAQATAYCDGLNVAGVTDWRLPQVGELGSITSSELISDGKFWSQTEGDQFGRTRVVWNTQTSRMGTAPVKWKGGRVVCVRTMAKAPEVPEEDQP